MLDDLVAIANAMEAFKTDHLGRYPDIREQLNGNQNVLCYDASARYAHDCGSAAFIQGYIDNDLLGKRYLQEVPLDPWTGSRYVYGRSLDGQFYQVAGLWQNDEGEWEARTAENLEKGFPLPSIVRAFDGPNFVVQRGEFLPYNPDATVLVATVRNVSGTLKAGGTDLEDGDFFREDSFYRKDTEGNETRLIAANTLSTIPDGRADLYFSDGSVTSLEPGTELELKELVVAENDHDSLVTKIKSKLLSGKIWSKVVRLSRASEFSVETTSLGNQKNRN